MMYATHKAGGALFALAGFEILSKTGMITPDIEPWLAMLIMYPASSFGSTFPDLDHNWNNVKEHTPVNLLIHKILHLTRPRHRSWQTHCLVITLALIAGAFTFLSLWQHYQWWGASQLTISLIYLMIAGFSLGIFSHLFLDTFTRAGIWLVPKVHLRLVPDTDVFGTGTTYETIWRVALYILDALLLIWVLNPFGLQQLIFGS